MTLQTIALLISGYLTVIIIVGACVVHFMAARHAEMDDR